MKLHPPPCGLLLTTMMAFSLTSGSAGQQPLRAVGAIDLPRVDGRIDHLAYDSAEQRLFVAGLGNNTVEVLDLKSGAHLKSLPGFREPQGIAVAPEARVIAVANGEGEGIQLLDANDYHLAKSAPLGDDSDNVRYDAGAHVFYVGYGGGALASVEPTEGKVLGNVKLAGHPESFQLEQSGSRIFVNVPDADQIAVVDRNTMKVMAIWPVTDARSNFPMALDEGNHRLFIGCRRPAKGLVYDTMTGKVTTSFSIVGDTDDLFYDAARKRVYVSGGEGYLDAFQDQGSGSFTRVARVQTAAGARTSLFVPERSQLYLAVPHRGSQKAEVRVYDVGP
jgi:DNA-binding beta-propeller fold protein YncE